MKYAPTQSGFTLVETLVAITILLMVISTPLAITSNSAKSSSFSSEQVTAFFLAQEGVELVTKGRDDILVYRFSGAPVVPSAWGYFISTTNSPYRLCFTTVNNGAGCDLTINQNGSLQLTNCANNGGAACQLYLNVASGNVRARYNHTVGSNLFTPFTRIITLEQITDSSGNVNEVKITSKVTWRTGSLRAGQEVVVESRLFNIYGN